ncbi:MAG TPA: tetratricopeptide repeat protein, partial [Polyangiaceae bacterium]
HLDQRLVENRRALEIAHAWPMAHVYYADTLCRLGRTEEAWPSYEKGFVLGPNDRSLVALGLQCLWDHGAVESRSPALVTLADEHPGTWLAWLCRDIVANGKTNGGVDKKYRPRGYDEGPGE